MSEKVNFIEHLKAFSQVALQEGLNSYDIAVYFWLFMSANAAFWEEWFEVSNSFLMESCRLKSHNTLNNAKAKLKSIGLIDYSQPKRGKKCLYKLAVGMSINDILEKGMSLNDIPYVTKCHTLCHQMTYPMSLNDILGRANPLGDKASESPKTYKTIKQDIYIGNVGEIPTEEDPKWHQLVTKYQDNINPGMTAIELERLSDLYEFAGADIVSQAIDIARAYGGTNIKYIETVVKNKKSEVKRNGSAGTGKAKKLGRVKKSISDEYLINKADPYEGIDPKYHDLVRECLENERKTNEYIQSLSERNGAES